MSRHPDSDVYPTATGVALQTVKEHEAEEPLKLYGAWFCPFVQRTWIVLEEKNIPYQWIEVNPYNKPHSLISLNPRGLVPTLEVPTSDSSKPLYESNVINEFLEDAYPTTPALRSEDLYERARARLWIEFVTSRIIPSVHRFLQFQGDDAGLDEKRQEFLGHLKTWTGEMSKDGTWFMGDRPTLVDWALAPWALRLWSIDHFKSGGVGIPEPGQGGADEAIWTRWRKWIQAVENRESVKKTTSEKEHFLPLYKRYADDVAQSDLAKSIRAGRDFVP